MKNMLLPLIALSCLLTPAWLQAQGPGPYTPPAANNPYSRPAFSPYLNLLRDGNRTNPAINYYGIVRPEINARNAIRNLQQQVNTVAAEAATQGASLPGTGHVTQFNNLSHYFSFQVPGGRPR